MNKCIIYNIAMTRGNTFGFDFELEGITELSSAFFSCRSNLGSNEYVFQKSIGNGITPIEEGIFNVKISPQDTKDQLIGDYYYDLKIGINDDVYTILKGILTLEWDVTR